MNEINLRAIRLVSIAGLLVLGLCVSAGAQDYGKAKTGMASKQNGAAPNFTARLVDPEKKAREKTATVEVTVGGVVLADPAKAGEKRVMGLVPGVKRAERTDQVRSASLGLSSC